MGTIMAKALWTLSLLVAWNAVQGHAETVKLTIPLLLAGPSAKQAIRTAEQQIREGTDDRVEIRFTAGQIKPSDVETLRLSDDQQRQLGRAQALYLLPGIIRSSDQAKALRPLMMTDLREQLEGSGLTLLGIEQGAAAHLMSTAEITGPADLAGKKLWVPSFNGQGGGATDLVTIPGVETVDTPPKKVPAALRSGEVDLVVAPIATAIALRWHHEITHVSGMPFMYLSRPVVVQNEALAGVSEEDRQSVEKVLANLLESLRVDAETMAARSERVLELQQIALTVASDAEREAWDDWYARMASDLIEKGLITRPRFKRVKEALAKTP